jgi:hypothetical protein
MKLNVKLPALFIFSFQQPFPSEHSHRNEPAALLPLFRITLLQMYTVRGND